MVAVTFDELALLSSSAPVSLRTRKEWGLLLLLIENHPKPVPRHRLVGYLWPGKPAKRATHSLSEAMRGLESLAEVPLVRTARDVGIDEKRFSVDLWEIRKGGARFDDALRNIRTLDWAPGFEAPTDPLQAWLTSRQKEIRVSLVAEAKERARNHHSRGQYAKTAALGRWLHACGQHDPPSAAVFVEALSLSEAGHHAAELRSVADHYGLPHPPPIDEQEAGPFVGREREFGLLSECLDEQERPAMKVALVAGQPGIGKTRLCERLGRLAAIRGYRTALVRCFEAEKAVAYGAVAECLMAVVRTADILKLDPVWRSSLSEAFPELHTEKTLKQTGDSNPSSQRRVFEAVTRAVEVAGEGSPLLVLIDDLQWIDPASCQLLHYLLRRAQPSGPVLFAFSYRENEIFAVPEAAHLVRALETDPKTLSLRLSGLSDGDAFEWLRALDPHRPDDVLHSIVSKAKGNPFFLRELLRAVRANQKITATVAEAIGDRLGRLNVDARRVAEILATAGTPVGTDLVQDAAQLQPGEFIAAAKALADAGWLSVGDQVSLSHDLVREAIYYGLRPSVQRLLHSRLAETALERAEVSENFLAHHYFHGGNRVAARRWASAAAGRCRLGHAYEEELRWLRMVLECSSPDEEDSARLHLIERLAKNALFKEAVEVAERLKDFNNHPTTQLVKLRYRALDAEARDDLSAAADIFFKMAVSELWDHWHVIEAGRLRLALAHAKADSRAVAKAVERLRQYAMSQSEPKKSGDAYRLAVLYDTYYGRMAAVRKDLQAATRKAKQSRDPLLLNSLRITRGLTRYWRGWLDHSMRDAEVAARKAADLGALDQHLSATILRSVLKTEQASFAMGIDLAEAAIRMARSADLPYEEDIARSNLAITCFEAGRYELMKSQVAPIIGRRSHPVWFIPCVAHALAGLAALEQGHVSEAVAHRNEIERRLLPIEVWVDDLSYVAIFLARAALRGSDDRAAKRILNASLKHYKKGPYPTYLRLTLEAVNMGFVPSAVLPKLRRTAARRGLTLHAIRAEEALGYN